jgi:hypothetical protein
MAQTMVASLLHKIRKLVGVEPSTQETDCQLLQRFIAAQDEVATFAGDSPAHRNVAQATGGARHGLVNAPTHTCGHRPSSGSATYFLNSSSICVFEGRSLAKPQETLPALSIRK